MTTEATVAGDTAGTRPIKWSYMDHWRANGPRGPYDQWHSRQTMTRFQI